MEAGRPVRLSHGPRRKMTAVGLWWPVVETVGCGWSVVFSIESTAFANGLELEFDYKH